MAHIPAIICGCGHEMLIKKTGTVLQANTDQPYYKVSADTFECPNCLAIAHIPARDVLAVQHEDRFGIIKHDAEFNLS